MTPDPKSTGRWRNLLHILWKAPLLSVPFALLFGTIFGGGIRAYLMAYRIALVFGFSVSLAIWAMKNFPPLGRIVDSKDVDAGTAVRISLMYTGAALLGSYAGSFIVSTFIMPGFMGTPRDLLLIGMFTLIFSSSDSPTPSRIRVREFLDGEEAGDDMTLFVIRATEPAG